MLWWADKVRNALQCVIARDGGGRNGYNMIDLYLQEQISSYRFVLAIICTILYVDCEIP